MNPDDLIALLEPLREPSPVHWWPPAPGWWLLALLLIVGAVALWRVWRERSRRLAPLRAARDELKQLGETATAPDVVVTRVAMLLRRVAMAVAGEDATAQTGSQWISYLNGLANAEQPLLSPTLAELPYRPDISEAQANAALDVCERWVEALERGR